MLVRLVWHELKLSDYLSLGRCLYLVERCRCYWQNKLNLDEELDLEPCRKRSDFDICCWNGQSEACLLSKFSRLKKLPVLGAGNAHHLLKLKISSETGFWSGSLGQKADRRQSFLKRAKSRVSDQIVLSTNGISQTAYSWWWVDARVRGCSAL